MKSPRGLRERKNTEVKRALYRAAMDLFQQKGFAETTVDEITARAGFGRATFFNHFGTKQGVLRQYGEEVRGLVEKLIEETESVSNPLEVIRELIMMMVREAEVRFEEVKLIYAYSVHDPDYLLDSTPARKRVFEILTDLVNRAQQCRLIRRDLPAPEIALHILFLYQGVVLAMITGMGEAESLLHSGWQFILEGVKGGKSPTADGAKDN
jgi:AcrR family transcriptional regulator